MSDKLTDRHGTPFHGLYAGRVQDRLVAEMLGVVKGMICDGVFNDAEAVALEQWLRSHPDVAVSFPGNVLAERIQAMFADGVIEEHEREELATIMRSLAGEADDQSGLMNRATRLPIDRPPPTIIFDSKSFCFTGIFAYGDRADCEAAVTDRGGRCAKSVTKTLDYLVVGLDASPAWVQGDHGIKVEKAVKWKSKGVPMAIVAEETWVQAIRIDE